MTLMKKYILFLIAAVFLLASLVVQPQLQNFFGDHLSPVVQAKEKPITIAQNLTDKQSGTFLLTIFLRHDQSKTLDEIDEQLKRTGFGKKFPPTGVEVVSWYVMMGIGQVVTLRVPPSKLREVNLVIEHAAWNAFRTDFYPTYDYKPIWEATQKSGG